MTRLNASSSAHALRDFSVPSRSRSAVDAAARLCEATLSAHDIAAISTAREARWRPGLVDQSLHNEIFASAREASGVGLGLALARDALRTVSSADDSLAEVQYRRQILWVQDARAIRLGGRPYRHGLPHDMRDRLIHVEAKTPEDALFALEEGLRCRDLACVIGEIVGNPRALDFTASRRLSLAAEKHRVALWLVRIDAEPDLSSARMRWRAEPATSQIPCWKAHALGKPNWRAELFRARSHAPGQWIVSDDETALRAKRPDRPEPALQPLGPALARKRRFWKSSGAPTPTPAPDTCHLVRATVGRSLAAHARA
ncbi:MAG: recA-like protein [Pseudomonadota bacterium]